MLSFNTGIYFNMNDSDNLFSPVTIIFSTKKSFANEFDTIEKKTNIEIVFIKNKNFRLSIIYFTTFFLKETYNHLYYSPKSKAVTSNISDSKNINPNFNKISWILLETGFLNIPS